MKTSQSLIYLSVLVLAGSLWTCTDHLSPAVSPGSTTVRLRVKTITQELPNNLAKVSALRYDGQGRLSSLLTYQTPDSTASEVETSIYQYDGQNRLTGLRHEAVVYPRGSQANPVEQYTYTYNGAGQVSSLSYANGFLLSFTYNGANQLATSGRQFSIPGISVSGGESFTFTGNNLTTLISARTLPLRGPSGDTRSVITYTHDDKINPFYGVYVIPAPYPNGFVNMMFSPNTVKTYFGGLENVLNLSRNNVLTEVTNSTTTIAGNATNGTVSAAYQYEYNASNLPTVRRTTINGVLTETLRFGYESY